MNKKAKRITVGLVAVLCFLLVFALGFGITGAWYEARRTATGTVTLDQGIKIDYANFAGTDEQNQATWAKDKVLTLFATTSGVPNAEFTAPAAQIAKTDEEGVIDYYVRVKVNYTYYLYGDESRLTIVGKNDGEYGAEGTVGYTADELYLYNTETNKAAATAVGDDGIVVKDWEYAEGWTLNADGYAYYTGAGATLEYLPEDPLTTIFDATGNKMTLADWTSEFGGPLVSTTAEGTTAEEVAQIVVTLTVEAVQPGAELPENLGWAVQAA